MSFLENIKVLSCLKRTTFGLDFKKVAWVFLAIFNHVRCLIVVFHIYLLLQTVILMFLSLQRWFFMTQKFHGGGGWGAKKLVPMSRYSVTVSICAVNCGRLLQSQHFTLIRLIIFMVFSVSVRGILVLGKFIVWVPSIWSRRLWPSVCTVWIYFKVYPISWHNIGKYCSTLYNNFFMIYNCLVYSIFAMHVCVHFCTIGVIRR